MGFVLRNLGLAKHIQMCQTGQKPIQELEYVHKHTYTEEWKDREKNIAELLRLQSNAEP